MAGFSFQLGKVQAVGHRVGTSEKEVALCVNGHCMAVLSPFLLTVKHLGYFSSGVKFSGERREKEGKTLL